MSSNLEEIKPETAEIIAARANACGLSIDEYLKRLLGISAGSQSGGKQGVDEFIAAMESLAEVPGRLETSPLTYSRQDIYLDHD